MSLRRRTLWLATSLISTLLPSGLRAAAPAEIHTVYLFPMSNGLDQYLASRLTKGHVLKVVTDPKAADAVITDRLGQSFEFKLQQARPELKPAPPKKDPADKDKKDDKDNNMDPVMVPPVSTFHAGQGNVFLVDARSQQVVWSTYQRAKNSTPQEIERTAAKIAKSIEKDLAVQTTVVAPPAPVVPAPVVPAPVVPPPAPPKK